jgi:hypothetical protein
MRSIIAGKQDGVFVTLYILLFPFPVVPCFYYPPHNDMDMDMEEEAPVSLVVAPLGAVMRQWSFLFVWPLPLHALRCLPPFLS